MAIHPVLTAFISNSVAILGMAIFTAAPRNGFTTEVSITRNKMRFLLYPADVFSVFIYRIRISKPDNIIFNKHFTGRISKFFKYFQIGSKPLQMLVLYP